MEAGETASNFELQAEADMVMVCPDKTRAMENTGEAPLIPWSANGEIGVKDRRCFLWRADGSSAGMFLLPISATEFPPAIQIFNPWGSPYFRQDPRQANMYRSLS